MTAVLATLGPGEQLVFPFAEYWPFYLGFGALVVALLGLDLFVFHRKSHAVSMREAAGWTAFWVSLSCAFGLGLYGYLANRFSGVAPEELHRLYGSATIAKEITLEFFTG